LVETYAVLALLSAFLLTIWLTAPRVLTFLQP